MGRESGVRGETLPGLVRRQRINATVDNIAPNGWHFAEAERIGDDS
jgi:hypothetical protein